VQVDSVAYRVQIFSESRLEVIEHPYLVASRNQRVDQVRTDEARSAGNKIVCQVLRISAREVEALLGGQDLHLLHVELRVELTARGGT